MKHLVILAVPALAVLAATALPFLPGPHDSAAVPLSGIARALGLGSILLVPIGLAWLVYELNRKGVGVHRARAGFVLAVLGAGSIAVLAAAVLAFGLSSAALAAGILAAWGFLLWRRGSRLLRWACRPGPRDAETPWTLILVPGIVAGAQLVLSGPLTTSAWDGTLDGMAPLIADLERYRAANGHYPRSLLAEWCDYRPGVIGVGRYLYEPAEDAYNLAVEVPTFSLDSREFLHYNPADAHVMPSHDAFLLQFTAAQLALHRGYHSARPLGRPHWVVLSFD